MAAAKESLVNTLQVLRQARILLGAIAVTFEERQAGDRTWSDAVELGVSIHYDIMEVISTDAFPRTSNVSPSLVGFLCQAGRWYFYGNKRGCHTAFGASMTSLRLIHSTVAHDIVEFSDRKAFGRCSVDLASFLGL